MTITPVNKILKGIIVIYVLAALFAPLIANEKPLYVRIGDQSFFPAFSPNSYINISNNDGQHKLLLAAIDWKNLKADQKIFPIVCWSPVKSDILNLYVSPFEKQLMTNSSELPFRFRHFLGTGKTGNDVLAEIIHGCRTSLSIGVCSMLIALCIGLLLGGVAGILGDEKLKASRGSVIFSVVMLIPAWFYGFHLRAGVISESFSNSPGAGIMQFLISIIIFLVLTLLPFLLRFPKKSYFGKAITIPVDSLLSRLIEVFLSVPRLILILVIAVLFQSSIALIIFIIGITSWTEFARVTRARILQLRATSFMEAARASGNTGSGILIKHLLPNMVIQLYVLLIFGIASAIIIETGLSFLGIGVPAGTATWGNLMFQARENYQAWWLVVSSGAAIFFLLSALFVLGQHLNNSGRKIIRS